jgi:hypothetical protein
VRELIGTAEREAGVVPADEQSLVDRVKALVAAGEFLPPELYAAMVAKDEPQRGGDLITKGWINDQMRGNCY